MFAVKSATETREGRQDVCHWPFVGVVSVGVVGGISGGAAITTTAGVMTGVSPIEDPYAKLAIPFSGCGVHNFTAKTKVTIDPGVYCGGMKLKANADVTLNAGIYIIDAAPLGQHARNAGPVGSDDTSRRRALDEDPAG